MPPKQKDKPDPKAPQPSKATRVPKRSRVPAEPLRQNPPRSKGSAQYKNPPTVPEDLAALPDPLDPAPPPHPPVPDPSPPALAPPPVPHASRPRVAAKPPKTTSDKRDEVTALVAQEKLEAAEYEKQRGKPRPQGTNAHAKLTKLEISTDAPPAVLPKAPSTPQPLSPQTRFTARPTASTPSATGGPDDDETNDHNEGDLRRLKSKIRRPANRLPETPQSPSPPKQHSERSSSAISHQLQVEPPLPRPPPAEDFFSSDDIDHGNRTPEDDQSDRPPNADHNQVDDDSLMYEREPSPEDHLEDATRKGKERAVTPSGLSDDVPFLKVVRHVRADVYDPQTYMNNPDPQSFYLRDISIFGSEEQAFCRLSEVFAKVAIQSTPLTEYGTKIHVPKSNGTGFAHVARGKELSEAPDMLDELPYNQQPIEWDQDDRTWFVKVFTTRPHNTSAPPPQPAALQQRITSSKKTRHPTTAKTPARPAHPLKRRHSSDDEVVELDAPPPPPPESSPERKRWKKMSDEEKPYEDRVINTMHRFWGNPKFGQSDRVANIREDLRRYRVAQDVLEKWDNCKYVPKGVDDPACEGFQITRDMVLKIANANPTGTTWKNTIKRFKTTSGGGLYRAPRAQQWANDPDGKLAPIYSHLTLNAFQRMVEDERNGKLGDSDDDGPLPVVKKRRVDDRPSAAGPSTSRHHGFSNRDDNSVWDDAPPRRPQGHGKAQQGESYRHHTDRGLKPHRGRSVTSDNLDASDDNDDDYEYRRR